MEPETLFSLANAAALVGWLLLAASLFVAGLRHWTWITTGLLLPAALAAAYIFSIATGWGRGPEGGGFGSIEQIRTLFASDHALTAGWIHYLAFDLFVGTWIARNGVRLRMSPLLLLPCLVLTFLLGPTGLLLFLGLRALLRRQDRLATE